MATYIELFELKQEPDLLNKLTSAIADVANDILGDPGNPGPPQNQPRLDWAAGAIIQPQPQASEFVWAVLIQNQAATPGQILGATDDAFKTAVQFAVDQRFPPS